MQGTIAPKAKEKLLKNISPAEHIDLRKLTRWLTALRVLQAGLVVVMLVLYFFGMDTNTLLILAFIVPVVLAENALLAFVLSKLAAYQEQEAQMREVLDGEQALIRQLRTQRHDFINHLQVVYALIQMKDYDQAENYVEQMYSDIQSVGQQMRTKCAAVNALLAAKSVQAEKRGVRMSMTIRTDLEVLPIQEWEVCRILANLLDNAMDAVADALEPVVELTLWEDVLGLHLKVFNNGTPIPEELEETIYQPGFTTKGERGTGMGLYIVKSTVEDHGGSIELNSRQEGTTFTLYLPPRKVFTGTGMAAADS